MIQKMYAGPKKRDEDVGQRARELGLGIWQSPNLAEATGYRPDKARELVPLKGAPKPAPEPRQDTADGPSPQLGKKNVLDATKE